MKRVWQRIYDFVYFQSWNWGLWSPPDRIFLTEQILPYFSSLPQTRRILFVGVRRYTRNYEKKFAPNQQYFTVDKDPDVQKFGGKRHLVADICRIDRYFEGDEASAGGMNDQKFDVVFLNGILGFGLNQITTIETALQALARVMSPDAWLVVGNHPNQMQNLEVALRGARGFDPCDFPALKKSLVRFRLPTYREETHEYRFFRRS